MELTDLTITQAHKGLLKKDFSALELCVAYLEKIREKDKEISAYLTVVREFALEQAKKIDDWILEGRELPMLAGIPCAIKDAILVEDIRCTAASKILENYIAPYDATCIKKLKELGAVILGKANMDEFAMGASGENSAYSATKNPLDLSRVPGGSSSGSAAAVAADMAVYSLGSDTAGSIRLPASFCGLTGLKPTYGAVSRYGLIAMASSLDQIGPLAKNVEDCRIVFDAIKGRDEMDSTSLNSKTELPFMEAMAKMRTQFSSPSKVQNSKFFEDGKIKNLRIGIPKEYFIKGMDERVEKVIKDAIKKYEELGAKIEEISLPHTEYAVPAYYIITPSEISANLARYDGIKYGYSDKETNELMEIYLRSRGRGFGDEVRRRIMLGTYVLSAGYYEAYYLRAQKVRSLIRDDFKKAFEKVDVMLTPVFPTTAFKLKEKIDDPVLMYLCDVFTGPVSLAGLPGLSLPAGKVDNLPVGMQIVGKPFEEETILSLGEIFEKA